MPAIVIAGALISQGPDSVSARHLLDALDFDPSMIVTVGQGDQACIFFGERLAATEESASLALAAAGRDPVALDILHRVREQWETDAEALMLRSQMGLDDHHANFIAFEAPEPLAAPKPRV